ncbi:hypothetical protein [Xanthomonas oryzae]|uniref:Uncharacterized protein n=5 Tax=Xanthomonas oryzae TaxID=347 RepID=A0A854CNE2_XANOO|nr:hypothetical protein [Xanthomonas oryzae]ACD61207.1 hypothetical protein PXO_03009 [Xanthomonas oryzae pv. oryzae PXO99A]AJQ85665.1 hypothetical protein AZ54_22180 [Xanthomonas oryzae pv. oryzae PXO86]AJQ86139.1 hypothetical protein BE73_02640 [Xanthomonas oryzae pv. oryzicola]AKN92073.1 hypothetical protein ACU13_02365 [Xanthomonas oryzae pv. oryzicola]AKN95813.1 hypothetical protein ACU10_02365 [Xanthomonas oryzae pv. oryzicola]
MAADGFDRAACAAFGALALSARGRFFDATRATPSAHRRVLHRHLDPFRLRNSRTYRTAADGTTF